ncbi:hypothetical protein ScalyP_jg4053 [Parmales sp. scaly parma]|nr:hypothetical protein ScalyP_jg4053 [Parmales sp. scaly parma]
MSTPSPKRARNEVNANDGTMSDVFNSPSPPSDDESNFSEPTMKKSKTSSTSSSSSKSKSKPKPKPKKSKSDASVEEYQHASLGSLNRDIRKYLFAVEAREKRKPQEIQSFQSQLDAILRNQSQLDAILLEQNANRSRKPSRNDSNDERCLESLDDPHNSPSFMARVTHNNNINNNHNSNNHHNQKSDEPAILAASQRATTQATMQEIEREKLQIEQEKRRSEEDTARHTLELQILQKQLVSLECEYIM